jgi:uncharacterized membrane protein
MVRRSKLMILATIPWGLQGREFALLCLVFGIFMGGLVIIVWVIASAWRDRAIARFQARIAEQEAARAKADLAQARIRTAGIPSGMNAPHSFAGNAGRKVVFEPPPTPKGPPQEMSADRVSGAADRQAGRTRLDLNPAAAPTEEN